MSEIDTGLFQHKHSARANSSFVGARGEELAAQFLVRSKYRLVLSNFKVPIGRNRKGVAVTGEIDIIALDRTILCFIEVKTRSSDEFNSPLSAVDVRKQRQITRTARIYRKIFNLGHLSFRYDVVGIVLNERTRPKIELVRNFWTEDKFRKKYWNDEIW